jgi:hypothetical protein
MPFFAFKNPIFDFSGHKNQNILTFMDLLEKYLNKKHQHLTERFYVRRGVCPAATLCELAALYPPKH